MPTGKTTTRPLCIHTWMDTYVCPGNVTNAYPGTRHVCGEPLGHLNNCQCQCGAQTSAPKE